MREILFRGKRIDNGEWIYGDLIQLHNQRNFIINNKFGACIDDKGDFINTESPFVCEVIPETIGQHTGLTANGTKIFEGDIVTADVYEREYEDEYLSNTPIKVTYCGGYFYPFHLEGCWRSGVSNIEIIGNIHDNPELLKEREQNG